MTNTRRNNTIFRKLENCTSTQHKLAEHYGISRKRIADIYYRELRVRNMLPKRKRVVHLTRKETGAILKADKK